MIITTNHTMTMTMSMGLGLVAYTMVWYSATVL